MQLPNNPAQRIESYWDTSSSTESFQLSTTDNQPHRVALYFCDYLNSGKSVTVKALDTAKGTVLDARQLTNYAAGVYLVYNYEGAVTFQVIDNNPSSTGITATVSAFFWGGSTGGGGVIPSGVPQLSVIKNNALDFQQGQEDSYFIKVSNIGTAATSGAVNMQDLLPVGLTEISLWGAGWTCTDATLSCTRSDPLPGGMAYPPISLEVAVAANAPASVTNSVVVTGGGMPGQVMASDVTTIVPQAVQLSVTKTHIGNFFQGQSGAAYTITVSNTGTAATSGYVGMYEQLPTGLTLVSLGGSGWTCSQSTLVCLRNDPLPSGRSYDPITLTVNVASNAPASVTNSVIVQCDTMYGTSIVNDVTTIITQGIPQLSVTKTHTGNFFQGQNGAAYTIKITNAGGGPTSGMVTMADLLPTGLMQASIGGTGWTCILATTTCSRTDPLASGMPYPPITLTVNVASNAPASVTNSASVTGGGTSGQATANDVTTIAPPSSAPVQFLGLDTTTLGTWKGVYGVDGAYIPALYYGSPSYSGFNPINVNERLLNYTTTDLRALQFPSNPAERIESYWETLGTESFQVSTSDQQSHPIELYFCDFSGGRTVTVNVIDTASGTVLNSQTLTNYTGGVYLKYSYMGNLTFQIVNKNPASSSITGSVNAFFWN